MGNKHPTEAPVNPEDDSPSLFDALPRDIILVILSFLPHSPFALDYSLRGSARREQRIALMLVCKRWRQVLEDFTSEVILPTQKDELAQVSQRFITGIQRYSRLTTLSLAGCQLIEERLLWSLFPNISSLTSLDLSRCPLPSRSLSGLGSIAPKLQSLNLRLTGAPDSMIAGVLQAATQLRHLNLSDCSFVAEGTIFALRELVHLESLDLNLTGGLRAQNVEALRCLKCGRQGGSGEFLCCGLARPPDQVTEELLMESLANLKQLRVLSLRGRQHVGDALLCTLAQTRPPLFSLDLDGCTQIHGPALKELLESVPSLLQLHINFCTSVLESEWEEICKMLNERGSAELAHKINREFDPSQLCEDDLCDVIDTVNKPYKSRVLLRVEPKKYVRNKGGHGIKLFFRYEGWGKEWDEWFDLSKPEQAQRLIPTAPLLFRRG